MFWAFLMSRDIRIAGREATKFSECAVERRRVKPDYEWARAVISGSLDGLLLGHFLRYDYFAAYFAAFCSVLQLGYYQLI